MRSVASSALVAFFASAGFWACSGTSTTYETGLDEQQGEGVIGGVGGTAASSAGQGASTTNPTSSTSATNGTTDANSSTTVTSGNVASGTTTATGNGAGVGGSSNDATGSTGTTGSGNECTDVPPDDRQTCATWAEWGECDNEDGWLDDYCDLSCGRCSGNATNGGGGSSNGGASNNDNSTSTTTASSTTGNLGDDNPWGEVNGGQQGWASRYWDCCKPSCGWSGNASNPVKSCDINDNSLGVTDEANACERNGTSGAFTCHSMAPWAYSNQVSLGFAAINGVSCGTCFHIQFTGTAQNGGNGPGAAALAGKHMIVMATNIGGIQQGQFDLLIPGGGVGALNGCAGQWGVDNSELGAQYGGFLSDCGSGDLNAAKSCMRNKCESVFGSRGLTELYDGCMWFVDWFQAADNPDFRYEQVDCPQELVSHAH